MLNTLGIKWYAKKIWADYKAKILSLDPILYYQLNETSGTVATNLGSIGSAGNGTFSNVALGNIASPITGDLAPLFNGSTSYVDMYSTALHDAFNADEYSFSAFVKVANSGVWTDGFNRRLFNIRVDAFNYVALNKSSTSNIIKQLHPVQVGVTLSSNSQSSTDWLHVCGTASLSNDRLRLYVNNDQTVKDPSGHGAWSTDPLDSDQVTIGTANKVALNAMWSGYICHFALFNYELSNMQAEFISAPI